MFFQRIKTPALAHHAYVLGSGGQALVVDPRRDVDAYLRVAREAGLTITHVLETHRQEDYLIGSLALARATGATIVTGAHERFGHGDLHLADGAELTVAGLRIRALHTPGHTPESTSYAVFVSEAPHLAWAVFTGDTLFAGATGRTDLTDPTRTAEYAGMLFDAVHEKLLPLGEQVLVFPAHGPGSVCGRHIAPRDETTLGLERATNSVFTLDREAFVRAKLAEHVPRPPYFDRVASLNARGGAPVARDPNEVRVLGAGAFDAARKQALVLDTRSPEAFAGGHLPGSLAIFRHLLGIFAGWFVGAGTKVLLVLEDEADATDAVAELARIGIDDVEGILAGGFGAWRDAGRPVERSGTISPSDLHERRGEFVVLDVREGSEHAEGHIEGSRHAYVGHLESRLESLGIRQSDRVAVTCSVGNRSGLAVSLLLRRGFRDVTNVLGGMTAWKRLGLPIVVG